MFRFDGLSLALLESQNVPSPTQCMTRDSYAKVFESFSSWDSRSALEGPKTRFSRPYPDLHGLRNARLEWPARRLHARLKKDVIRALGVVRRPIDAKTPL